jgi:hypothetical protein
MPCLLIQQRLKLTGYCKGDNLVHFAAYTIVVNKAHIPVSISRIADAFAWN